MRAISQLQYPHSLYIPSSLLTETKRAAQFGVLIIPFSCAIYRARFARSLTPHQPQGPGSNSVHSHPALSCLMLWPALVGGQPVLVCDTERKPKSFSTFPPGPLLGSSWSLPCNAPLSQRPSQSSTATVKCTVTVSAGAGIPSPAQPLSTGKLCRLCPSFMCWVHVATPVSSNHETGCSRGHPH